jgi:PTH1 family peptidyl-tRNA hydrolase
MNKSGESVKKVADYYKILPENIIVLYDEIDLPTGKIQKKIG